MKSRINYGEKDTRVCDKCMKDIDIDNENHLISDSVFKNWRSDYGAKNEISPKAFEQWEINYEPLLPMEENKNEK